MIDGIEYIGLFDFVLLPILLISIFLVSYRHKRKREVENPLYKYYLKGLIVKLFGAVAFSLIYVFYYKGGDTVGFFDNAKAMANLFFYDPFVFFKSIFAKHRVMLEATWAHLDFYCDYCKEGEWLTAKFYIPFVILGFKRYLFTTVIVSWFSFLGIWKLFLVFAEQYPKMEKKIAIAILFIPSIAFWGSGILKDTITFTCACWYTFAIYNLFIKKHKIAKSLIIVILTSSIIVAVKPYILIALLPASIVWASYARVARIENKIMKVVVAPFLIVFGVGIGIMALSLFGSRLDTYSSTDKVLKKAKVTRDDLVRGEQYGQNYYDIGSFDASATGMLKKAPLAIIAGLFRPFLWDARNPVMLISGLENFYILCLFIFIAFRVGPFNLIKFIGSEPLLFFSFIFAIVFAFAVGLTTANYGALVRYRIPAIPFFVASLFILLEKVKEYRLLRNERNKK